MLNFVKKIQFTMFESSWLTQNSQPIYFLCSLSIGSHQLVLELSVFLLNLFTHEDRFPSKETKC
jgi:hypothetical protein